MKKLKLLLINPPKLHAVMTENDSAYYSNEGHKPPIQLLFLASYIERVLPEVEVRILDTQVSGLSHQASVEAVVAFEPDVIGITSWTEFWYDTSLLIENIKNRLPKVHICLGGPNTGIYPEFLLEHKAVDSVVCGYGEQPLEILLRLLIGKSADSVDGLYFKHDLKQVSEFKRNTYIDQQNCQSLRRDKLPIFSYSSLLCDGPATSLMTSKGCPFQCVYCKIVTQKFCTFPVDFVIEEFRSVNNLGIKEVEVYDDTFTISKERVQDICHRLIDEKIDINWSIRDRVTNNDADILQLLKQAGVQRINYGIEAATDATLKRIKKSIRIADVRKAVTNAKEAGLTVLAYFMIGLPGDTREDFRKILDLSLELDIDYANYSAVIAYPGTELYVTALSQGIFQEDVWQQYIKNPSQDMNMPLYTEACKREELIEYVNMCNKRFYFRPKAIFRELKRLSSFSQFKRKLKVATAIVSQ